MEFISYVSVCCNPALQCDEIVLVLVFPFSVQVQLHLPVSQSCHVSSGLKQFHQKVNRTWLRKVSLSSLLKTFTTL